MEEYPKYDFSEEFKILGLNVAYYRKSRGLTQLQLSEMAGISRTHMSNIEACGVPTSISLKALFSIAKVLEIPAYKLLIIPTDLGGEIEYVPPKSEQET